MRAATAFVLLLPALAACEPQRTIPDVGPFPTDGAVRSDASACAVSGCMHGGSDMGTDAGDVDGGPPDDGAVDAGFDSGVACDSLRAGNRVTVNPATPFTTMRAYAVWDTVSPCPQTLHVVLSDAPLCDGSGQAVAVSLSKRAIDSGALAVGTYMITAGTSLPFGVEYIRPMPLSTPGVYGPCVSMVQSSSIRFDTLNYASSTMTVSGSLDAWVVNCTTLAGPFELIVDFDVVVMTAPPVCP